MNNINLMGRREALRLFAVVLPISSAVAALTAAGCGGSSTSNSIGIGSAGGRGVVAFTIHWPERGSGGESRLVPSAAQSIKFRVFSLHPATEEPVFEKVVPRPADGSPTSKVLLEDIPSVKVRIVAAAFPSADGTGVAQASGSIEVAVEEEQTVSQSLTMGSTITEVRILPGTPEAVATVEEGETLALSASAFNAQGALVLTSGEKWNWTSSATSKATVDPSGLSTLVRGVAQGTTNITALDTESGKSAQVTLSVSAATGSIIVSPSDAFVDIGATKVFSANVADVTWSATGGSISSSGLFTAGDTPGEFVITATKDGATGRVNVTVLGPTVFGRWGGVDGGGFEAMDVGSDVVSDDGNVISGPWFINVDEFTKTARVTRRFRTNVLLGPQRFAEFPAIEAVFNLTGTPQHMTGTSSSGASIDMQAFSMPLRLDGSRDQFLKLRITGLPGIVEYHAELSDPPNPRDRQIIRTELATNSTWVSDNRLRTPSGVARSAITRSNGSAGDFLPPG